MVYETNQLVKPTILSIPPMNLTIASFPLHPSLYLDVNRLLQPTAAAGNRQMAPPQPPAPSASSSKGPHKKRPKSASAAVKQQTCVVLH